MFAARCGSAPTYQIFRPFVSSGPTWTLFIFFVFREQGDTWFETFVCGAVFQQLAVAHDLSGKSEFCVSGEVRMQYFGRRDQLVLPLSHQPATALAARLSTRRPSWDCGLGELKRSCNGVREGV